MQVETYEVEECVGGVAGTTPEVEAEAAELIERLGLDGQKGLIAPSEDGEPARCPYRAMTAAEANVYGVLCDQVTAIVEYEQGLIPVRVLQVAAHAREYFQILEVWHARGMEKDPVLVGRRLKYHAPHVLARWGEVLEPFERLVERAREVLRRRWKADAEVKLAETQTFLAALNAKVEQYLAGQYVSRL